MFQQVHPACLCFSVETCRFSGCTDKATTDPGLNVHICQHGRGDKVGKWELWFCSLSLQPAACSQQADTHISPRCPSKSKTWWFSHLLSPPEMWSFTKSGRVWQIRELTRKKHTFYLLLSQVWIWSTQFHLFFYFSNEFEGYPEVRLLLGNHYETPKPGKLFIINLQHKIRAPQHKSTTKYGVKPSQCKPLTASWSALSIYTHTLPL